MTREFSDERNGVFLYIYTVRRIIFPAAFPVAARNDFARSWLPRGETQCLRGITFAVTVPLAQVAGLFNRSSFKSTSHREEEMRFFLARSRSVVRCSVTSPETKSEKTRMRVSHRKFHDALIANKRTKRGVAVATVQSQGRRVR